jgi:hypothetical protein
MRDESDEDVFCEMLETAVLAARESGSPILTCLIMLVSWINVDVIGVKLALDPWLLRLEEDTLFISSVFGLLQLAVTCLAGKSVSAS